MTDRAREEIARLLSKLFTEVRQEALDDKIPSLRVMAVMPESDDVSQILALSFKGKDGKTYKVGVYCENSEMPEGYPEDVFPTTTKEAGDLLRKYKLSDDEISAVSGSICRLGWENCWEEVLKEGYRKIEG